ncbi:MAG TPA: amino acid adenylation domain-containing protein [Thermoanaerobaculia bacterium]|nr:amino acid adenylation domain-containing protein [Thermoanaerobaculia bacterium]
MDFMLDDAGISALVLAPGSPLSSGAIPSLTVDSGGHLQGVRGEPALPATDPLSTAGLDSLAYVMYTSGSTGLPKGVEVPHAGVLRLLWRADYATLDGRQTLLQAAPMSFDASTFEVWGALLFGGRCVLMPHKIPTGESLRAVIGRHGIDTLFLTTALFNAVVDEGPEALRGVSQLLFGGEAVSLPHVRRYRQDLPHTALLHCYGPTESTTFTCFQPVPSALGAATSLPIGRPIVNTRMYVLDRHLELVGLGVVGELYIGGRGLARGYLRRPSLTADHFLPDPFSHQAGARLYRTGDLVRWRFPNAVEFVGRRDQQVKVRGHRIELPEIEIRLRSHAAVADAVVLVREDQPGQKVLVAYLTAKGGTAPATDELLAFLLAKLPDYMVPRTFVTLPAMPLTTSGKIDRQALRAAEPTLDAAGAYTAPATPTEETVAGIWSIVLDRERISRNDDFFALGGHSLLATQVVLRLRQAFSIELPIHTLFENPQLSSFALCVEQAAAEAVQSPETVLERVPRDGDLPLSFAQRRLWFLDQLEPGSPVYTIPAAVRLAGRLDTESLARSLDEIVRRHEVLRTRFPAVGGEPVQRIVPEASFPLERVDLTPLPEDRRDAVAMQRAETAARQPFDLATGPLLRGLLLQLRDEDHVLVVAMSHVVADGWSIGVLTRELGALYDAFSRGLPSPLPELPIQYADFAHWQRQRLNGEVLEEQLLYWRERLRGAPERLDLPSDRPRPPLPSFAGASALFSWAPELSAALHRLGADQDATAFMTLLAAFQILLYRQSGQADLSVGTPVANRTLVESEALIGFFVNTLVLRVQLDDQPTFRQLLRRVREVALSAYAHQDVPFEMVVEALRPQRATGSSPLFQVLFNFGNTPGEDLRLPGLTLHLLDTELGTSKRDLTLSATDTGERLQGALTYSSDLFDPATIRRLVEQLETLLASVVAHPEARVSELEILSEAARHQLLWGWNDTAPEPPPEAGGVHVLFERQADRTLANLALVGEGGQLTFAELETRANQLAHLLRRRGVGPEVLVALYLERSEETVVALLAVLKAGGAYLPLDPGEPRQSLAFILGDARPQLLVTRATLSAGLPAECPGTVLLDTDGPAIARESGARPSSRTVPDHLLYVIYTSGSTGRPKGVLIAHRQMLNYVACLNRRLDLPPGTGYAMVSTFAADLGCTMLYPALTSGGCLHVLPQNRAADPVAFAEYLERHTIDALKIVPSHLAALLASSRPEAVLPRRLLVLGGEASRWEWIEKIEALAPRCVVLNHYGPTETTVGVMALRLTRAAGRRGPVPLGQPLAGTQVYVLDRHLRPVPFGVAGQIHVGGVALGRGYLDRPDLTAERFIPDPFRRTPGGRLYTTGDLARHLPDDTLEFLGRADHQIKLRGFRIELGEIESVLRAHPGVREAVVALREEAEGDRRLVAYLVSGSTGEPVPAASELRARLRERLPEHMVPAAFVALPELPLTPNGKVDRRALPAPEGTPAAPDQARVPPRDVLELQLVQTWQDLLGVQPIGIHDNFFDLGGHSLLMVTLIARLRSTFGKVPPLAALLQQPTVAELAALLRRKGGAAEGALVRMQPRGTRKPFFCVHPAGGTVLSYLELARQMGPEQPFYALQSNGGENGHGVEELARRYLAEVLAAQPEGPYSLGGHSFGGVVAYEMARQLEAQGRTVALLALFDAAPASPDERSLRDQDGRLMASFALHLGLPVDEELLAAPELAELTADEQLSEVLRRAKQAGLVPSDMRHDEAHHLLTLLKSHVAARLRYVPQPYPGRVTLFRAQEQLLAAAAVDGQPDLAPAVQSIVRQVADPAMGWGELAAGGVEVNELPGTHYSMLRPPHVTTLADRLKTCLERSSRPEG